MDEKQQALKRLPSVDLVLNCPELAVSSAPHCLVLEAAREAIAQARTTILHGATAPGAISAAELGAIRADAL
ncbi:MAG: hypothetical protein RBR43_05050, partial [Desulfuromonadaceae bacterium]|nr:hypothetical protein [Desulfuromonadaceae bacterium]